ncbi:MAG: ergothioneine biosynthesis protein EgtB [Planctomycetota bacterium]
MLRRTAAPGPERVKTADPERFARVRRTTLDLARTLEPEDMQVQSMPDVSPTKWHLGHTTWFFETFVLESEEGFEPFDPAFRVLFNSYYQQVGARHPRPHRGLLTRPRLAEVLAYRAHVDERIDELLRRDPEDLGERLALIELGLQHEQQHQELVLMDIKHVLSCNPLDPAFMDGAAPTSPESAPQELHRFGGGLVELGHRGEGFAFDNEGPSHRAYVDEFRLASRPITNHELLQFVDDGGYRTPTLWLSDAWDRIQTTEPWDAPMYWERRDEGWMQFTLHGLEPLRLDDPATHLSYYEADAFARWAGSRLPRESEWEVAAAGRPIEGNLLEPDLRQGGQWHPRAYGGAYTDAADAPVQLFGDVWEWTQSPYAAYPGYRASEGAVGEYNGKFMANQFVLRGGSWATSREHVRATYRNFFHPWTRWHFGGLRLAMDAIPGRVSAG